MPSNTPVPYCSPCASTCTFASPHGTSFPLNQMVSVGVKPIRHSCSQRAEYITFAGLRTDIRCDVSEFRIEKRRTEAALTLATGATIQGCFFLSGSRATHSG